MCGIEVTLSVPILEHQDIMDGKPIEVEERYKVWKPKDGSHTCFFRRHIQAVDLEKRIIVFSKDFHLVLPDHKWEEYFPKEWFENELIFSNEELLGLGIRILKSSVCGVRDLETGKTLFPPSDEQPRH